MKQKQSHENAGTEIKLKYDVKNLHRYCIFIRQTGNQRDMCYCLQSAPQPCNCVCSQFVSFNKEVSKKFKTTSVTKYHDVVDWDKFVPKRTNTVDVQNSLDVKYEIKGDEQEWH